MVVSLFVTRLLATPARPTKLNLPPEATEGLQLVYSGDPDAAMELFRKIQAQQPENPLGYLLEANARWWKLYCETCDVKWGTIDAWHRPRLAEDDDYLELADKATRLAEAQLRERDSAEMRFYAGMGCLLRGRLMGLRDDRRGTARAGVRAREHLLRAIQLDPDLADARTGLGLYNYYVDTLYTLAKMLRLLMGIPGGDKKEGVRQLETGMNQGELTAVEARFYLTKNLRNYDRKYARALELLAPLVERYPQNPLFHLLRGDIHAKRNHKEMAASSFQAAQKLVIRDPDCHARVQQVTRAVLATLGASSANSTAPNRKPRMSAAQDSP